MPPAAATLGAELGYALGHYGGRPTADRYQSILRISPSTLKRGEDMFVRYGAVAISCPFSSSACAPCRTASRSPAHALGKLLALFNFLGAAAWVTIIASAGYLFGHHWHTLLRTMQRFNIAVLIVAGTVILYLWWRHRHEPQRQEATNSISRGGKI